MMCACLVFLSRAFGSSFAFVTVFVVVVAAPVVFVTPLSLPLRKFRYENETCPSVTCICRQHRFGNKAWNKSFICTQIWEFPEIEGRASFPVFCSETGQNRSNRINNTHGFRSRCFVFVTTFATVPVFSFSLLPHNLFFVTFPGQHFRFCNLTFIFVRQGRVGFVFSDRSPNSIEACSISVQYIDDLPLCCLRPC